MFANKTLQSITNTGTGTYQFNSTGVGAWKSWRSQFATGTEVLYFATREDGQVWEFGRGTLTHATPDTMTRTLILSSTGSLIDWVPGDGTVYVMSAPMAQALEGRWDSSGGFFVPAFRRSWSAVGAGNKSVSTSDAAGRFSLDNSAAARTVTLPAISSVPVGFNIEVRGLSMAYSVTITPNGSEVIDHLSGGGSLSIPGRCPVVIFSDGSQWRTDYDHSAMHRVGGLYTAVGAAGKTVAAADEWGRYTLDNSAAARTVTLPAISAVRQGFGVEVYGLSQLYYLNIAPNGTDIIDGGSAGQTLPLPGKVWVRVWSDGTQWRTDFDYTAMHIMAIAQPSAAAAVDFTSLPYWANNVEAEFQLVPATDAVDFYLRTYGADGVLDTGGADYAYATGAATSLSGSGFAGSGGASAIVITRPGNPADNTSLIGVQGKLNFSNVRSSLYTLCTYSSTYLDSGGSVLLGCFGGGWRAEADIITGIRFVFSSGNCTGRVTLRVGA